MRDAAGWRRARAAVGQVLPGGDDFPALRHRSCVSLSVGAGASATRMDRVLSGGAVHGAPPGWLHLRLAKGRTRLGPRHLAARTRLAIVDGSRLTTDTWVSKLKSPF